MIDRLARRLRRQAGDDLSPSLVAALASIECRTRTRKTAYLAQRLRTLDAGQFVLFQLHGSALDLGITAALQFGPVLILDPVGGLLADRFDKRRLLLFTQAAFAAQALALGLLVANGSAQLWMVWLRWDLRSRGS